MDFLAKPKSIEEILRLISTTETGNNLLQTFIPELKKGRIRIAYYPSPIVKKLRALIGQDQPIGACFDTDGTVGTIHLDREGVLGVLAPFLVHEIVHSLDPTLWQAANKKLSHKGRNKILLRSELQAFKTQHQFMSELKQLYSQYQQALLHLYPRAKILHERLTEESISDLYGFRKVS